MRTSVITAVIILVCCFTARFARAAEGPMFARPYSLEILDEGGNSLPTFEQAGRTYVLGTLGQRYLLRVANQTGQRIEVVASVDGRDVIDGQPPRRRGHRRGGICRTAAVHSHAPSFPAGPESRGTRA